jgi:short-subunit dehydrogenase
MPTAKQGLSGTYPTALVTGASSGIGKAFARRLLDEGVAVYGTTRNPASDGLDPRVQWLPFDGSSPEGVEGFVNAQAHLLSKVTILINNAGSSCFGKGSEIPFEIIRAQYCLLLEAPVRLTQVALQGMRARGKGTIVNVSSLAGIFPIPYMEHYSAAKAALSAYSQGLILTEKASGVTLIDFQAGDYNTAFNRNIARYGEMDSSQQRVWQRLERNIAAAPPPEQAAEDLVRALARQRSRTLRSGGFFQRCVAPLGPRLLPRRLLNALIRRYFHLGS